MYQPNSGAHSELADTDAAASGHVAPPTDNAATNIYSQPNDATPSRHRFTMTVEDVASRLHTYGVDRDARTIQRWCKSGKLQGIIDTANGDRWLIDPATLQPVIDKILEDASRQPTPLTTVSAPLVSHVVAPSEPSRQTADTPNNSHGNHTDIYRDAPTASDDSAATSPEDADNVATLKKRVSELELKLTQAKADVHARESLNEYMKEQFEKMIDTALDRSEQVGQLQAENEALRQALPAADTAQATLFRPASVVTHESYEPANLAFQETSYPHDQGGRAV